MENKILIYCRESRDDNFEHFDRIETQAKMLVDYAKNTNLGNIIDIILDDNKTGSDFQRLEPIKKRILNKEFNIFLCKDCSRIGRNLLESLKFIEFLEKYNVQLIFLTEIYDEDIFPIKAWFNQLRLKDDSKKIKGVLHQKMIEGTLLIKAPFGYNKIDKSLVINTETSESVKLIFKLFLNGYSKKAIANHLNTQGFKTPSMYKTQYNKTTKWNISQIDRILKNETYKGTMIYNKKIKKNISKNQYTNNDKKNWIILENHHQPIISISDFEKARSIICNKHTKTRIHTKNPFADILYCGECGSKMYLKTRNNKSYYICKTYNTYGNNKCTSKKIDETFLQHTILEYLIKMIKTDEIKNQILDFFSNSDSLLDTKSIQQNIDKTKSKISLLYDDKQNGIIPPYLFTQKLNEYSKMIKTYENQLINTNNQKSSLLDINIIIKKLSNHSFTNDEINTLFDKILIYDNPENTILFI